MVHSSARARRGNISAALRFPELIATVTLLIVSTDVLASQTVIEAPPGSELSHAEILEGIYGGTFVGSGADLGSGLFQVFDNGTVFATRMSDGGLGAELNLVTGGPGTGDDRIWTDGIAVTSARARYAAFPQQFGYALSGKHVKLFDVAGSGFSVSGEAKVRFGVGSQWAWSRANDFGGEAVGDQFSVESMNVDGLDHMVTYQITGIPDVPDEITTWLILWEDLNGELGATSDPNNQGIPSDRDFNDLVVEVRALECQVDADCPGNEVCETQDGVCRECVVHGDCVGGLLCEPVFGVCQRCIINEHCLDIDETCDNECLSGVCVCQGPCDFPNLVLVDTSLTLLPLNIDVRQETVGPVSTQVTFSIWNQNESRFSGTSRCVTCWDQTLLSLYEAPNHFLIQNLQTDRGKARIDAVASNACGDSSDVVLVGLATQNVRCPKDGPVADAPIAMRTAATPRGAGYERANILFDVIAPPGELTQNLFNVGKNELLDGEALSVSTEWRAGQTKVAGDPAGQPAPRRLSISTKGSVLVWPSVEVAWSAEGNVIKDTFIELTNDYPGDVVVQVILINGDPPLDAVTTGDPPMVLERAHPGWNHAGTHVLLTANQSVYWSAATGQPAGVSPLPVLDPGDPPGRPSEAGRVVRGFMVAWAVNAAGHEIRWNHLSGGATVVSYADQTAHEYPSYAVQCVSDTPNGAEPDAFPGHLRLDGIEYAKGFGSLYLDFFSSGSSGLSAGPPADLLP